MARAGVTQGGARLAMQVAAAVGQTGVVQVSLTSTLLLVGGCQSRTAVLRMLLLLC